MNFRRIGITVLIAVIVTSILTVCGLGHGKPAAIGLFVAVLAQMALRAVGNARARTR
jgi:hypothetical protein